MTCSSSLVMKYYSVHPRDWIFAKGYGFLSFPRNMCKNIGNNIRNDSKNKK